MRDEDKTVLGCLGVLAWIAISFPLCSIVYGWALSVLWGWFMVPTFHLPALSKVAAVGVAITVRLITYQSSADSDEDKDESAVVRLGGATIKALLVPLFSLGFGWIVLQFM